MLLLPGDLDAGGWLIERHRPMVQLKADDPALVRAGDVLFTARGAQHSAYLATDKLTGMAAAQSFMMIRPDVDVLEPAYLAAYLNHGWAQRQWRERITRSTAVQSLNKADLLSVVIPLPPIQEQRRRAHLLQLWQQEQRLTDELRRQKEQFYQLAFVAGLEEPSNNNITLSNNAYNHSLHQFPSDIQLVR